MKKSLFDISDDMLAIREMFDNFDGDVTDGDVAGWIDKLFEAGKENEEEFDRKVDSYIWLIKEMRNDAAGCKTESDRLSALKKRKEDHADKLVNRLAETFKRLKITERKTKYHHPKFVDKGGIRAIEYNLTGWSLDTENPGEDKPVEACYVKTIHDLNKDAIREDLEAGKTLPFAKLKEKEPYLKIK